jgi:large conductance mechanosensitive channel
LVSDIILPIISLLPFLSRNFEEKFIVLRPGDNPDDDIKQGYNTVKQALEDGALVWAWGLFVEKLLHFVMISISLFLIASFYSWATKDNIVKKQVKCRYCRKWINEKAKRCVNCTSWVDGREDKDQPQ